MNIIKKELKYYFLGVLSAFAGIIAIVLVLFISAKLMVSKDIYEITTISESPNKTYKAVSIHSSGGGAAGYSNQFVTIIPYKTEIDPKALADIMKADFETNGNEVELNWENDSTFNIGYKVNNYTSTTQNNYSHNGKIRIKYNILNP